MPVDVFPAWRAVIPEQVRWAEDGFSPSLCLPRLCRFRKTPLLHFTQFSAAQMITQTAKQCGLGAPNCVPQVLKNSPSEVMHSSPWQSLPWCIFKCFTSCTNLRCSTLPCLLLERSFAPSSNFWHLIVGLNIRKPKTPFRGATRRARSYN